MSKPEIVPKIHGTKRQSCSGWRNKESLYSYKGINVYTVKQLLSSDERLNSDLFSYSKDYELQPREKVQKSGK